MRPTILTLLFAAVLTAPLAAASQPPGTRGTVSGSMTVNGEKAPLTLSYVDESDDNIIVVLASKEVPADAVPFIGEEVARKFKIHAVVFTVDRKTRQVGRGLNGVYYPGEDMGYVGMREGAASLQVKRMDAGGIDARVFTPQPVSLSDLTYTFDATFSIPLGAAAPPPPPVAVKISGDLSSQPAAVYADYYRAIHAGDTRKMLTFVTAARAKEYDAMDAKTKEMVLELMTSGPPEIRIGKPVIAGNVATLSVEGLNLQTTKATADVTMVLEGKAWKVEKERWSTTSK